MHRADYLHNFVPAIKGAAVGSEGGPGGVKSEAEGGGTSNQLNGANAETEVSWTF